MNKKVLYILFVACALILANCSLLAGVTDSPPEDEALQAGEAEAPLYPESFADSLGKYVLRPEDMPNDYSLPPDSEFHNSNLRLIQELGELEAKRYIDATGRIDGWFIHIQRVNKEDFSPYEVESSIELFKTKEGAQIAMGPDWFRAYTDQTGDVVWDEGGCDLGDQCLFYHWQTTDPETDIVKVRYEVAFTYRNVMFWVMGRSLDIDIKPEYMLGIAQAAFNKLEAAAP
jgi:hypothetical protein